LSALPLVGLALGEGPARAPARRAIGVAALLVAADLLVCRTYFGSALPLPLRAKATGLYGEAFAATFRPRTLVELRTFAMQWWPLFLVTAWGSLRIRELIGRLSRAERWIVAGALLHTAWIA